MSGAGEGTEGQLKHWKGQSSCRTGGHWKGSYFSICEWDGWEEMKTDEFMSAMQKKRAELLPNLSKTTRKKLF